jgi:hypothetical protein
MANETENTLAQNEATPEQIAQNYKAALDSVSLINSFVASAPEGLDEDERKDAVKRNVEHLEIMVAKTYWTNEDLAPLNNAISAGKAFVG